ncbi:MAG: hypothetical protein A2033_06235 [Bacteroidetes bacterium GWA2_31_9]|nr:MAG: hypothetical protein A2033_06235 [Bacteroidetes bacterium GWA2_31_9]
MAGSKGSKYYDVFLNYKIWLSYRDETILDEYLLKLLEAIDKSGSLMTASKELKISYRKAWGDLKKAEKTLGITFTDKVRGGKSGGKSILTEEGKNIINAYNELKNEFDVSLSKVTKKFFNTINK